MKPHNWIKTWASNGTKRMTPSVNGTSAMNGMNKDLSFTNGWSNRVMIEDLLALPIGKRLHISVGFGYKIFIPP